MKGLLKLLTSRGVNQGLMEGNRTWIILGGAALALRILQRLGNPEPKVVFSQELKPGETYVFTHDRGIEEAAAYGHGRRVKPSRKETRKVKGAPKPDKASKRAAKADELAE